MGFCLLILALVSAGTPETGTIAYLESRSDEGYSVKTIDLASGTVKEIEASGDNGPPQWSEEGLRLAFEHKTSDGRVISMVDADGTNLVRIGEGLGSCFSPSWSPAWNETSEFLAFTSVPSEATGPGQLLHVYDREGGQIQTWGGGKALFLQPKWLPNNRFSLLLDPAESLPGLDVQRFLQDFEKFGGLCCIMLREQKGKLTAEPALVTRNDALPLSLLDASGGYNYVATSISPHTSGSRLAFDSNDGGDREIFVLSEQRLIDVSNHRAADWNPVWAPKNREILFESFRGGNRGIYHVYADTARVDAIDASISYGAWSPSWSENGKWIAYVSDKGGAPDIYFKNIRSDEAGNLSEILGDKEKERFAPAWRPESKP